MDDKNVFHWDKEVNRAGAKMCMMFSVAWIVKIVFIEVYIINWWICIPYDENETK